MTLPVPHRSPKARIGLVGAGAFGAFAVPHLARHADVAVHDPRPDLAGLCAGWGATPVGLAEAAARPVVVLAVPLAALEAVARALVPHVGPGTLVVDVCSVKVRPLALLRRLLPPATRVVGVHPLFGPNSGRNGIAGLKAVVCRDGGRGEAAVRRFLREALRLDVVSATPDEHDRQMAYVQALSHLVGRSLKGLGLPGIALETAAYAQLERLVDLVGGDSGALFDTIVAGNPYAPAVLERFMTVAGEIVAGVTCGEGG